MKPKESPKKEKSKEKENVKSSKPAATLRQEKKNVVPLQKSHPIAEVDQNAGKKLYHFIF